MKYLHGEVKAAGADVAFSAGGCGTQPVAELFSEALRQVSRRAVEELHRKPHHQAVCLVCGRSRHPGRHCTRCCCRLHRSQELSLPRFTRFSLFTNWTECNRIRHKRQLGTSHALTVWAQYLLPGSWLVIGRFLTNGFQGLLQMI